jgi:hypothetical protein
VKSPVKIAFHDGTSVEVPELSLSDSILLVGSTPLQDGQAVVAKQLSVVAP